MVIGRASYIEIDTIMIAMTTALRRMGLEETYSRRSSLVLVCLMCALVTLDAVTPTHAPQLTDIRPDCRRHQADATRDRETDREERGRLEHGDRMLPDFSSCATVRRHQGRHRRAAADLFSPDVDVPNASGRAVYFSGSPEVLQFKGLKMNGSITAHASESAHPHAQPFPRHQFTVALWVQPEGGQATPVVLMGLYDTCNPPGIIWALGVQTGSGSAEKDATIFLSVHGGRSRRPTVLVSHKRLLPARWSHLAAVYDGRRIHLYIDGGRVATGSGQKGPLFSSAISSCVALLLGGSREDQRYFRGKIADVMVWGTSLLHREVIDNMRSGPERSRHGLVSAYHRESFETLRNFETLNNMPRVVTSDVNHKRHDLTLRAPPCGMTSCDDPDVITSYTGNWQLRTRKIIKYRIINLANDDGTNPTVSPEQIKRQDRALRAAFSPHNITFRLIEHKVTNTSLRQRVILEECEPEMVGNGVCNCACQHPSTGNDGGDCDVVTSDVQNFCNSATVGDGKCDDRCNINYYGWDGGDCCLSHSGHSCRDPTSPYRSYMTLTEYKKLIALPGDSHLNIFFANWTNPDLLGIATFPWDRKVHAVMGGAVMQPEVYGTQGRTDNLVHEFGHVFGLLHVHYGVSGLECSDPCRETEASLTLGDLCEDTKPTPQNGYCRDPVEDVTAGVCGIGPFSDTPYRNYMSYTDDACMDHFTPQQAARMHCYMDLTYQRWQDVPKPSPVPLPPRVIASTLDSVTLRWLPPIGSGATAIDQICIDCRVDGSLVQFASSAWSEGTWMGDAIWSPTQATGAPDASPCTSSSPLAWGPNIQLWPSRGKMLEVAFKYPVRPRRLSIWVIYKAYKGIGDVELVFKDGAVKRLGAITAQCDTPYTTLLGMEKLLTKVRFHVKDHLTRIDAVMVESEPNHTGCDVCPTIQYAVTRKPPFPEGRVITNTTNLVDNDVLHAQSDTYIYRVQAILGSKLSELSPVLVHTHGESYCGDGILDRQTEECDDGNVLVGDGCGLTCKMEQFFRCHGEPSVCVHHLGDGVCEEFEKRSSLIDCGFFTPDGASDQWAILARANLSHQTSSCPESAIVGAPDFDIATTCRMRYFPRDLVWTPCGGNESADLWIEAFFARPVVATAVIVYAHLSIYGAIWSQNTTLHVTLIGVNNTTRHTGSSVRITCDSQPIVFDVRHNLNTDFFFTKGVRLSFRSHHVGISGVALRTRSSVRHQAAALCTTDQLYNPNTGSCVPYSCERPLCDTFAIKHGNATCTGSKDGDRCHVMCHMGYERSGGHTHAVCVGGQWSDATHCALVSCGPPAIPYARLDCPDGHLYGKKCKFECKRPARKIGTGNMLVCEDDALWSLPEAYCEMRCPASPVVKHASLVHQKCNNTQPVGVTCKYRCTKGYQVVGPRTSTRRRIHWYRCTNAGTWVGPTCERIHCPHIAPVLHGLYSCTQSHYYRSTCTLKCPGPTRVTSSITCGANGQWNSRFTKCKFEPGECAAPSGNDDLRFSCAEQDIGMRCDVSCHNTSQEPVVRRRNNQGPPGNQDNVITHVTCTGQRLWHPDVDDVRCVEKCAVGEVGDGICQAGTNRAHCRWDGGDCCASTTPGGIVRQAPEVCSTSGCLCKDPNVTEQRPSSDTRTMRGWHYLQNYFYSRNSLEDVGVGDEDREHDGGGGKENGTPAN